MLARTRHACTSFLVLICLALPSLLGGTARATPARGRDAAGGTLTVFAAASLKEAFTTIGAAFGRANNATVQFNFGGSDQLEAQIAQGAPADVFASADQLHMQLAVSKGLIAGTPAVFTHNRLIVIVPKSNPAHIYSLPDLGRPGVALVLAAATVPVGKYARAAFVQMAADEAFGPNFLQRIERNIRSNEVDVKAVATKVALGEADAGVVYVTDVTPQEAAQVQTIEIPPPFNQLATYPIAITKSSHDAALARKFVSYVLSPAGQAALKARNFIVGGPVGGYSPSFTVGGLVQAPMTYTVADLRTLPATTVTATLRTDTGTQGTHSYTGVLLNTVIQRAGLVPNPSFKNNALRQFVTVGATDGYQVSMGMAEILPQFGNEKVILAYERDGKPLSQDEGAVRLIVPGDALAGRWVSNVNSVVVGAPVGTP